MNPAVVGTAIGSLPHFDPSGACQLAARSLPQAPFWPQLPKRDFREGMYIQYSEGLPGARLDQERRKMYFQTDPEELAEEILAFTDSIMEDRVDDFAVSPEYSAGLHCFLAGGAQWVTPEAVFVKGHITGPISYGLTVTDQKNRPILYDALVSELMVQGLMMKARWQVRRLKQLHREVVLFIDEPYLASFGSAFIAVDREQVIGNLSLVVGAIQAEGARVGVHCCGNTDWTLLMDAGVNIVNFDAVSYCQSLSLYPKQLTEFLEAGGQLAWGITPSSSQIRAETAESVVRRFWDGVEMITYRGVPRELLLREVLVTPSCGAGSLETAEAERILQVTSEAAAALNDHLTG